VVSGCGGAAVWHNPYHGEFLIHGIPGLARRRPHAEALALSIAPTLQLLLDG